MTLDLAGRSLSDAIREVRSQQHWGIIGLSRNRGHAFEPWCSSEPFSQYVLQRLEQIWGEFEKRPPRAKLPALVLIVGSHRSQLDRPSVYESLRDIVDKLLHSDFHWWPGNEASAILNGCFIRDQETLDKTVAEVAKLRTTAHVAIRESVPLSADELRDAIVPHQRQLERLHAEIATKIEALLAPYVGQQPATVEEGQSVCRIINDLLAAFGLRLQAAQVSLPSTLAYYRIGRTKAGAFVFTGMNEGKRQVVYGATSLPALKVVPAPEHGRRQPKTRGKKKP